MPLPNPWRPTGIGPKHRNPLSDLTGTPGLGILSLSQTWLWCGLVLTWRSSAVAANFWQQSRQQLLQLLLANGCALCQRSTAGSLCRACQQQIQYCQLTTPLQMTAMGLPLLSWGAYEGSLKRAIAALKYGGEVDLAQDLGLDLGKTWRSYCSPALRPSPLLVPIPLHPSKLQQRGFNQAELLAHWVGRVGQVPYLGDGLHRLQATQAQHSLSPSARRQNLAQALAVNHQRLKVLRSRPVWLVDDIYTTGATVEAATQVLTRAGVEVLGICTLARATLHSPKVD
jgi:ComF family protein